MTPLQKYLKKHRADKLDIDSFGAIMDDFLNQAEVGLLITSPAGSDQIKVQENTGGGPTIALFFLLKSIRQVCQDMVALTGKKWDAKKLADTIADLVRDDILEGFGEKTEA